jgi:Fic family protein
MSLIDKYPHLKFEKQWNVNTELSYLLGSCESLVEAIKDAPLAPKVHTELLRVSLIKGANATTAIEGNTLSVEDIKQILNGKNLPESRVYLQKEVENVLRAFNFILEEVVSNSFDGLIQPELIKKYNSFVGAELGEHFDAIPGIFRRDNRIVGNYRCPDPEDIEELVNLLCSWLKVEFGFKRENQSFSQNVIQAIVTHIYLEWIHPFGDGNGRTGRLLEFYILLRHGNPDIASHILSNHYNLTRSDYYRQIQNATTTRDLTSFLVYALRGFRDGLKETLAIVRDYQIGITWKSLIYDEFEELNKSMKKPNSKRIRRLILDWPLNSYLEIEFIRSVSKNVAQLYKDKSNVTIKRDLQFLIDHDLLLKIGILYVPNKDKLLRLLPKRKIKEA